MDELRDRAAVRARQRRRPHRPAALLGDAVSSPITLGIVAGYVVGKPLGSSARPWLALAVQARRARSDDELAGAAGGGTVAGIGFTVSLLISSLAFTASGSTRRRSACSPRRCSPPLVAWVVFRGDRAPARAACAPAQLSGTADEILDLVRRRRPGARPHPRPRATPRSRSSSTATSSAPTAARPSPSIRELLDACGDDVRYVWRHLPLNDVHPNAQLAAEASEAAARAGRLLGDARHAARAPGRADADDLRRYAQELGLDVDRFMDEVRRREYIERVATTSPAPTRAAYLGRRPSSSTAAATRASTTSATLTAAVRQARTRARLREKAAQPPEPQPAG